jgi:hypothetical protein
VKTRDELSVINKIFSTFEWVGHHWLTSVILAIGDAELRRITVRGQPGQIVNEDQSQKYPSQTRSGGVAQVIENLPSKLKAQSLNHNAGKKNF